MSQDFPAIRRATEYSASVLDSIRAGLEELRLSGDVCVVATGSFGRQEASGESDVDFFVLHGSQTEDSEAESIRQRVQTRISEVVPKPPAVDGAFNAVQRVDEMLSNIGGAGDTNEKLTRRLLLLLEGTWLFNGDYFAQVREQIVYRYITPKIVNNGIARFLLNDVIRYYRTMCVDFEYKTVEQQKPWGIRNLKLMYSRKLLYFGGVVAVAETAQREYQDKIDRLIALLNRTPIQRLQDLFGSQADECLSYYDAFLQNLEDQKFRERVESVRADRSTHTDEFRKLKNESTHFTWGLERLLRIRYSPAHPIHVALIL